MESFATAPAAPFFGRMCRACMAKEQNFHSILDNGDGQLKISEMLATAAPLLHIQANDRLPELICTVCLNKLNIAYHFQQMCIASDKRLRAQLVTQDRTTAKSITNDALSTQQDPLLEQTDFILHDCLKMEIFEEDTKLLNLNVQHADKPTTETMLADQRHASDSEWSESDESQNAKSKAPLATLRRGRSKAQHTAYSSSLHNKTIKHAKTHPESQHKCHLCSKSFPIKALLIEHLNKHKGLKSFVCLYCDKSYQHHSSLKAHLQTHTGEKSYLCPQCGKSFHNSSNMRQHLLRHTGEKRYQCPECPSRFACNSDQKKHMSTHRTIKPHVCDICGSRFSRSYTLNKHKRIHTGERPHKCEECNMTFIFIDHMRRHMRTHTGEKPYKCKYCDRAYAEGGDLTKHLRTHVGEKTYICSECPEAFKYLTQLRNHKAEHYHAQQQRQEPPAEEQDQLEVTATRTTLSKISPNNAT